MLSLFPRRMNRSLVDDGNASWRLEACQQAVFILKPQDFVRRTSHKFEKQEKINVNSLERDIGTRP